ncbi:MAG: hypothetical protein GY797_11470 [Deltaproteobacteria bacterium]|nr:hypothetical protein [Deltaproteobacteria bacterium]
MKKWIVRTLYLVMAGLMFECATLSEPIETLDFDFHKKYVYSGSFYIGNAVTHRFVFKGQSIYDWTEALEILNMYKGNFPPSPKEAYNNLIEYRKKSAPKQLLALSA